MGILTCNLAEVDRSFQLEDGQNGQYQLTWHIQADSDNHHAGSILQMAQALTASPGVVPVAKYGDVYSLLDYTDNGSFARSFRGGVADKSTRDFIIQVGYKPPDPGQPIQLDPNPLNYPIQYWVEWIEEQVPIESAICLTDMMQIKRGPKYYEDGPLAGGTPGKDLDIPSEPGPIVNACGQQTVDPVLKTVYHPVIYALKNMPSYLTACGLNATYMETMNSDEFLNDQPFQWRFLYAKAEQKQEKRVGAKTIIYYPTIIALEYRRATWNKKVLNNGMVTFKYLSPDSPHPNPGKGGNQLIQVKDNPKTTVDESKPPRPARSPVQVHTNPDDPATDTLVDAAEPMKLNLDGVQLLDDGDTATFIDYQYLTPVPYGGEEGMGIF